MRTWAAALGTLQIPGGLSFALMSLQQDGHMCGAGWHGWENGGQETKPQAWVRWEVNWYSYIKPGTKRSDTTSQWGFWGHKTSECWKLTEPLNEGARKENVLFGPCFSVEKRKDPRLNNLEPQACSHTHLGKHSHCQCHPQNPQARILVKRVLGASLVAQWLRIRLPMQGTWVRALVREDPTCCGATKPVRHNYWACEPQLLKPACLEPVLRNKRSHCNEKPAHRNEE